MFAEHPFLGYNSQELSSSWVSEAGTDIAT